MRENVTDKPFHCFADRGYDHRRYLQLIFRTVDIR